MLDVSGKSFSRQLSETIRSAGMPLHLMYCRLWDHERVADYVLPFLTLMHQVVRASVPLMEAASRRSAERADSDPLCRRLRDYLDTHIEEERYHDRWILEDLQAGGVDADDVLSRMPPANVAAMVGAQYYWIEHHHPVALLGYIRLLEGNPPSLRHIDRLIAVTKLPAGVFRTYRMHGELDPHHLEDLDRLFDSLPLTPDLAGLVETSATFTAHTLARAIGDLLISEQV